MTSQTLTDILYCLSNDERMIFPYFKDRYALQLLSYFVAMEQDQQKAINQIKQSPYQGLLNKPLLKNITKQCANGFLHTKELNDYWEGMPLMYRLTLDKWGETVGKKWRGSRDYHQTSRAGQNLVLQLNFCGGDHKAYNKYLKRTDDQYALFQAGCHPTKINTLAWARLDLDLDTGEALIEEVQSDWARHVSDDAKLIKNRVKKAADKKEYFDWNKPFYKHCSYKSFLEYYTKYCEAHVKLWQEAIVAATIWFLRNELGIRRIFYHHYETSLKLKQLQDWKPPRSIYTKLPKRFCFQLTKDYPSFLEKDIRHRLKKELRKDEVRFYKLEF